MHIATAFYDTNDTLVAPIYWRTDVPYSDTITAQPGFWHRFRNIYPTIDERDAVITVLDNLFDTKNASVIGYDLNEVYQGNTTYYELDVTYVVEAAYRTPFPAIRPQHVKSTFAYPEDPIVTTDASNLLKALA